MAVVERWPLKRGGRYTEVAVVEKVVKRDGRYREVAVLEW